MVATVQFRIFSFPVWYLKIPVILYGCEAWFVGVRKGRTCSLCSDIPVKSVRGAVHAAQLYNADCTNRVLKVFGSKRK
jgi:hypothetical protein